MKTQTPQTIFLKDYRPPQFLIDTVDLHIDLAEEWTTVKAKLNFRRNPASSENSETLVLNGHKMELMAVILDNVELTQDQYQVDESQLTINDVPENLYCQRRSGFNRKTTPSLRGFTNPVNCSALNANQKVSVK